MCYYQVRLSVWYVYFLHFSSTFILRYNLFVKDNHRSSLRRNVYVAQRLLLVGLCVHCLYYTCKYKYQINFYYVLFLMLYNNKTEYFFFYWKLVLFCYQYIRRKACKKCLLSCLLVQNNWKECVLQQLHFTQKGKGLVILFPRK